MEEKRQQQIDSEDINLLEIWNILWDSKKFIVVFTSIITFFAGILSFLLPKVYTSEAVIVQVSGKSEADALFQLVGLPSVSVADRDQSNIKAILESNTLRERVIKELNLIDQILKEEKHKYKNPYYVASQRLKGNIRIITNQKDGTISIKVDWGDPETAQKINQSLIKNLQQILNEKAFSVAKMNRIFYEAELSRTDRELKEAIQNLNRFQSENQVILPENRLQSQLQLYGSLVAEKLKLEAELRSYSNLYSSEHPKIREITSRLTFLNRKISEVEGEIKTNSPISMEKTLSAMPEYMSLYLNVQKLKGKYEVLSKLLEEARIEELKENVYIEIIDAPSYPERPSKPRKKMIVATAFVGSMFLAVFIVLVRRAIIDGKYKKQSV